MEEFGVLYGGIWCILTRNLVYIDEEFGVSVESFGVSVEEFGASVESFGVKSSGVSSGLKKCHHLKYYNHL